MHFPMPQPTPAPETTDETRARMAPRAASAAAGPAGAAVVVGRIVAVAHRNSRPAAHIAVVAAAAAAEAAAAAAAGPTRPTRCSLLLSLRAALQWRFFVVSCCRGRSLRAATGRSLLQLDRWMHLSGKGAGNWSQRFQGVQILYCVDDVAQECVKKRRA